ncbi:uncharacterized protein LOC144712328 [Wolffia australiana]
MAKVGYAGRRVGDSRPVARRSKGLGTDGKQGKFKPGSLKKQIRSAERMLRQNLPAVVKEAQENKLKMLKEQLELQSRLAVERKTFLRDRKKKFFERRKIERTIRRLEKQQRSSSDHASEDKIINELSKLKEDLEYVRFFPKTEKYIPLFIGVDDPEMIEKRNELRKKIKANLVSAAASGKDLEETGSEEDGLLDTSDDDFFIDGSSSEVEADDEWTDKSAREPASSASGKAASGVSSDEKNQRHESARALMPPPRPSSHLSKNSSRGQWRPPSSSTARPSSSRRNSHADHSSNLSSNSDAYKPRRKRRPKKKKQT